MMRVKMIGRRYLDQFLAPGKLMWEQMKKIESTDDKTGEETRDGGAQKDKKNPEKLACLCRLREKIKPQTYQSDRDNDERDEPNQTIENDRQKSARLLVRFFKEEIAFDDIASRSSWQELVVKHSNQEQTGHSPKGEPNILDA